MIRERRSKEKLQRYYEQFITEGNLDHNIHPWVAESWKRCLSRKIGTVQSSSMSMLNEAELNERLENNKEAIDFIDGLYECNKQCFTNHKLNLALFDEESYMLKSYCIPNHSEKSLYSPGIRVSERDIGTTSVSISKEHKTPFLLFGAETWIRDLHQGGDAFSVPIIVDGRLRYLISFFAIDSETVPYDWLLAMLLNIKYSLENRMQLYEKTVALSTLLDELPYAVYCVRPGGKVSYANASGQKRLDGSNNLSEVFLNYEHIPINKGFHGMPSHNKEIIWIARDRTYEDITTVLPLKTGDEISSIITASASIEDLKTIVAHAASYSSRYSILSMVGETDDFIALQNKTTRVAKGDNNVLLQGEPGTGKQRLAHGIHQASSRAANPLIVVKCGKVAENILDSEIFGYGEESTGWVSGKLELAHTGTLFIDEIEKLPINTGNKLAKALMVKRLNASGNKKRINVRLIAACDSNLKRLSEKGLFSTSLYDLLAKIIIRVPSLRERAADIEPLANHILSEMAMQHNLPPKRLNADAMTVLQQCTWPGNIKQLQGVLEMAFFHTPGTVINADNIKLPGNSIVGKSWKHDKDAFVEAWKASGGNISKLGIMLDVSRVTLYRYLKKYGLDKHSED